MFINTVILGTNLNLQLLFNENANLTPSSATLRMYTPAVASPYWSQVGADIDILVSGGEIATGLWGITVSTSGYAAGQYSLYLEWVSPVTGFTYASNASFNVAADATTLLQNVNALAAEISRRPLPDNRSINEIREALGIKHNWNMLAMVEEESKRHENIVGSLKDIVKRLNKTSETAATIKENVKKNDEKKTTELKTSVSEMKFEMNRLIDSLNIAMRTLNINNPTRSDLFASFDLFSKEMASLFGKVDLVREQLIEIEAKIAEVEAVLPGEVANNLSGMASAAAQNMLRQTIAPQQNPMQQNMQPTMMG